MPIQEDNIVFVESQVMDDVPEGGGAATGRVIPDGVMNNVFPDISDVDRAMGRFNLRKISLAIRSLDTDLFGGAKTVFTALPSDPAIGYAAFTTHDPFDTRADAQNRVEAYLYKGPMWHGALHENHIKGMRAISVIQRVDTALPPVGKTLCLVQDEGLPAEREQYVRVIGVDAVLTTFTDAQGDFYRWIVRMDLSHDLRFDFTGHTVNRNDAYTWTGKTRIRDTTVADATQYFGSTRLAEAAGIGDLSIRCESMFARLVPSAQTETPLVSQTLAGELAPMIASAAAPLTYSVAGAAFAPNGRFVVRSGFMPGTLSVGIGSTVYTDDAAGNAIRNGVVIGSVNYASGETLFNASAPTASGTASVTCVPAAAAAQQAHTRALDVTAENRRLNWIETLLPIPAPGTLSIAYMAQGNWYVLRDDGAGTIAGTDPTFGAGTLSYVTGDAPITLGALPDAGSQILYTWASPVHYAIRAGATSDADSTVRMSFTLPGEGPVKPGSLSLTWYADEVEYVATDGAAGVISGDHCTGRIDTHTRLVELAFSLLPDRATGIDCAWSDLTGDPETVTVAGVLTATGNAFDLGGAVEAGTVQLNAVPMRLESYTYSEHVRINGVWEWVDRTVPAGDFVMPVVDGGDGLLYRRGNDGKRTSERWGTIDYATGLGTIERYPAPFRRQWNGEAWTSVPLVYNVREGIEFGSTTLVTSGATAPQTHHYDSAAAPVELDLTGTIADPCVVGSALFSLGGLTYTDRGGVLYASIDPTTGSGTVAGTFDADAGVASITYWQDGAAVSLSVLALLTRYGDWSTTEASFRTAARPLKPEALSIVATTTDGVQITGVADEDGVISGTWMSGSVNYEFGIGSLSFGQFDGSDWVPREVDPGSIRYNAVAYSYIPLDADILGIDPVRLPPDGRVPIYRPGNLVLVLHAAETDPATVGNGGTIDTRPRVAWVRVSDANGDRVSGDLYTLDRATGVVTIPDASGIDMPVTVRHYVADLRMVTDAQINGQLTLARRLTHEFPAGETIVAACLLHGDRRARVSAAWDQAAWDGTWVDNIVGSAATATLNLIDHPITVTNEGCDTDRWLLRFLTSTTAELISEKRGLVWSGSYTAGGADIAPINPRTRTWDDGSQTWIGGTPYMTIPGAANGGGWSAGNVVRINTVGVIADMWIARAIQQSDEPLDEGADGCEIHALGNIDRP